MLQIYNSSVSHELLTPLKCIVEISQKLLDKQLDSASEFNV